MNARTSFPLALTIAERNTTTRAPWPDRGVRGYPSDVCTATYRQGATLSEDTVSVRFQGLLDEPDRDETALSWNRSRGFLIREDGRLLTLVPSESPRLLPCPILAEPRLSPDGTCLWERYRPEPGVHRYALRATRLDSGAPLSPWAWPGESVGTYAFDDKGGRLVVFLQGERESRFVGLRPSEGTCETLLRCPSLDARQLALSPDGQQLAYLDGADGHIKSLDLRHSSVRQVSEENVEAKAEEEHIWTLYDGAHRSHPTFSPDGSRIFYTRGNTRLDPDESQTYGSLYAALTEGGEPRKVAGDRFKNQCIHQICVGPVGVPAADGE